MLNPTVIGGGGSGEIDPALEGRVAAVEQTAADHETRLDSAEGRMDGFQGQIDSRFNGVYDSLNSSVGNLYDALNSNISGVYNTLNGNVSSIYGAINGNVAALDARLDVLEANDPELLQDDIVLVGTVSFDPDASPATLGIPAYGSGQMHALSTYLPGFRNDASIRAMLDYWQTMLASNGQASVELRPQPDGKAVAVLRSTIPFTLAGDQGYDGFFPALGFANGAYAMPAPRRVVDAVKALEASGGGGGGDTSALEARLTAAEGTVAEHESRIEALEAVPPPLNSDDIVQLRGRVETAEAEIDALQTDVTGHGGRLEAVEGTVAQVDANLGDLVNQVQDHESRIAAIEAGGGGDPVDLAPLEGRVSSVEDAIEAHASRIGTAEAALAEHDSVLAVLQSGSGGTGYAPWIGTTNVIRVPSEQPTLKAALALVRSKPRAFGAKVEILLADGAHNNEGETLVLDGEDLSWVTIRPAAALVEHVATAGANLTMSGCVRDFTLTVPLAEADAATYAVGDWVFLSSPSPIIPDPSSGSRGHWFGWKGLWRVSAVATASISVHYPASPAIQASMAVNTIGSVRVRKARAVFPSAVTWMELRRGSRSPVLKDFGIVTANGYANPTLGVCGIRADASSVLNVWQDPDVNTPDSIHFGITGFNVGIILDGADLSGTLAVSGSHTHGIRARNRSRIMSRLLYCNANGAGGLSGHGLWLEGSDAIASMSATAEYASSFSCNFEKGIQADRNSDCSVVNVSFAGNASDIQAQVQSRVSIGPTGSTVVVSTSPALGTNGNTNSFISRA